jgi:predicted nucleic acid-binding protein
MLPMTRRNGNFAPLRHVAWAYSQASIPGAPKQHARWSAGASGGAMPANALIDTGAILALLDRSDRWHDSCVDAFHQLRLPLLTSEAVLTELFHLVGDTRSEMEAAWRFVRSGALVLGTIEDAELQHVHGLMSRYWDRPMDFADGTLVYLAKREFLSVILTVDHADFATYRIEGKRQFRVLPANHP